MTSQLQAVEETKVPGEKLRLTPSHWQLSHIYKSSSFNAHSKELMSDNAISFNSSTTTVVVYTVEAVYIEHSREMKKCSMYAGVQYIQLLSNWRSGEIEIKARVIRET